MKLLLSFIVSLTICLACSHAHSQARAIKEGERGHRIALLIGNGAYKQDGMPSSDHRPLPILLNPCRDVDAVEAELTLRNWQPAEIIKKCDVDRAGLRNAIDDFKDAYVMNRQTFAFVYYSGHGVQVGNDTVLFGIDASMNLHELEGAATDHPDGNFYRGGVRLFGDLVSQVGDAGSGSIFIAIDACRETPLDTYFRSQGKAIPYQNQFYRGPAAGIKVLYSTAYGQLASDGVANGSPFGIAFVQHLRQEGNVDQLASLVARTVYQNTKLAQVKQMPNSSGDLNPPPPQTCLTVCGVTP